MGTLDNTRETNTDNSWLLICAVKTTEFGDMVGDHIGKAGRDPWGDDGIWTETWEFKKTIQK